MAEMNDSTDHEYIDVKKVRPIHGGMATVSEISIEKGLRDSFRAANNALSYVNVAIAMQKDCFHEFFQDDGGDAMALILENANDALSTAWALIDDLGRSLGVSVHAKEEEREEEAAEA